MSKEPEIILLISAVQYTCTVTIIFNELLIQWSEKKEKTTTTRIRSIYIHYWNTKTICNINNMVVSLQSFSEIIETTAKNGVAPVAISNVKLF